MSPGESPQQQAFLFFHDVYGGYWPTSYSIPGRSAAADVAAAVDAVLLGTPSELGSVAPGSSSVVSTLPESPSTGQDVAVLTDFMFAEATLAATQPAVVLHNPNNVWLERIFVVLLLPSLRSTVE